MVGRAGSAVALLLVLFGPSFAAEKQVPAGADQVQLSFAPIVKRVAPAVVNVYASRTIAPQVSPFFSDPFFRQFFSGGPQNGARPAGPRLRVVIDPSGLVVTNFHVINRPTRCAWRCPTSASSPPTSSSRTTLGPRRASHSRRRR
jgi:S1-C subfamily serine protease